MEKIYKIALIVMLFAVIFSLGQAMYFMMHDKGKTNRSVWALTRRVALSFAFIGMIVLGIWMGWLTPHGIGQ